MWPIAQRLLEEAVAGGPSAAILGIEQEILDVYRQALGQAMSLVRVGRARPQLVPRRKTAQDALSIEAHQMAIPRVVTEPHLGIVGVRHLVQHGGHSQSIQRAMAAGDNASFVGTCTNDGRKAAVQMNAVRRSAVACQLQERELLRRWWRRGANSGVCLRTPGYPHFAPIPGCVSLGSMIERHHDRLG